MRKEKYDDRCEMEGRRLGESASSAGRRMNDVETMLEGVIAEFDRAVDKLRNDYELK